MTKKKNSILKRKKRCLRRFWQIVSFFRDKRPIFRFNAKNGSTTDVNIYICNVEINTVDQHQLLFVCRHYPMCVKGYKIVVWIGIFWISMCDEKMSHNWWPADVCRQAFLCRNLCFEEKSFHFRRVFFRLKARFFLFKGQNVRWLAKNDLLCMGK